MPDQPPVGAEGDVGHDTSKGPSSNKGWNEDERPKNKLPSSVTSQNEDGKKTNDRQFDQNALLDLRAFREKNEDYQKDRRFDAD